MMITGILPCRLLGARTYVTTAMTAAAAGMSAMVAEFYTSG